MGMEPDIENLTLNEYLEYEAAEARKLWDNVRSRRSVINYDEADVDFFHRNIEQDDDLEEDQEDDGDNRDTFDIWDIIVEDVERIRKFLTPNILNIAMVDEEADPTRDLEELERLLVENPHFMKIQVHSIITKIEPFIHTQPMCPLYGIFESYKSSTKPCKVDREMKSPSRYGLKSSFPYPVANEHSNDVYCYFPPHLIPSEEMDTLLHSSLETLRDFTRPLGPPSGLKGLLHKLNAIVIPTKLLRYDAHGGVLG
ncbi:hypothetical protein Tco_0892264 [Tanacetum coccineum]|uniref:Uncharacterized protein n=1 Tax=Tanacetum coccineum TaxID=301880 RepID=A0ABQ5C790_9ASTR